MGFINFNCQITEPVLLSQFQRIITNASSCKIYLSRNSVHTSNDSRRVSATDGLVVELLAVLVEEEGRHSRDAVVGSDIGELVNVDLVELDVGLLGAELLDSRGDGLARSAPGGVEVDDDGIGGLLDEGLPLLVTEKYKLFVFLAPERG